MYEHWYTCTVLVRKYRYVQAKQNAQYALDCSYCIQYTSGVDCRYTFITFNLRVAI